MKEWIDRETALALLGVKAQTLYAYVSRGRISMRPDADDSRRSLYLHEDIAALAKRRARDRRPAAIAEGSMAWGEPAIPTRLSCVHHGKLYYRGRDAIALARTATLEETAAWLWDSAQTLSFPPSDGAGRDPFSALARSIPTQASLLGRGHDDLCRDAGAVVGVLASAMGCDHSTEPVHQRLATLWRLEDADAERVRQALVVMADHDLNASTFAVRVAASTGASLAACVLAGLCTLSGPRHGGASAALAGVLEEAGDVGALEAVKHWCDRGHGVPGFGHPLYPAGDPRAVRILENLDVDPLMAEVRTLVADMTGLRPNCDFALTALVRARNLPADAPFVIFMIGRSIGWCAHAMEQVLEGDLIRPRGRYIDVLPE